MMKMHMHGENQLKKRTKTKTPRRTSTRIRSRTAKGIYYDEHFDELNANSNPDETKAVECTSLEVTTSTSSELELNSSNAIPTVECEKPISPAESAGPSTESA